ncbi:terpene synthase family protein [Sorangium sp. So ce1078]|uniref:terpene synthase family protein n=1 Tax=Sorangium sp. So ce1078 TaxID=3133329 RepID=UPI003F5ED466
MNRRAGSGATQTSGRAESYGERLAGVELDLPDLERVRIPDLLLPVKHSVSEHLEQIRSPYVDWVVNAKLVEPGTRGHDVLMRMKLDDCAALIFPDHPRELVLYGAISLALFFALDDVVDDVNADLSKKLAYIRRVGQIASGDAPAAPDDHVVWAWHRWFKEIEALASPPVFETFAGALRFHLRALRAQTLEDQSAVLCPTAYLMRRRDNVGSSYFMPLAAIFLEREHGLSMRGVLEDQHVKSITELAALVIVIHNELLGLYKDTRSGEANFVALLRREHGIGLQNACDLSGRLADDMVKAMVQMEADLPALVDGYEEKAEAIARCVRTAYSLIRGTFDWYRITRRYYDEKYFSM